MDSDQAQETPRKKRPRDADVDLSESSDIYPQVSPGSPRSIAGTRRVSTSPASHVSQQQQEPPNFSLPMYSNELGSLPIYGQFRFSDFSLPVQSSDNFVVPDPMGMLPNNMQYASVAHPLPGGQVMGTLIDYNQGDNNQIPLTFSDFNALSSAYDLNILSGFGEMPPMDNDTMALWSAAPTNLACVFLLLLLSF